MESKTCGSTLDMAEMIVDYKTGKTEIKGVPENNLKNRVKSAFFEWLKYLGILIVILYIIFWLFGKTQIITATWIKISFGTAVLFSLFHINKKFDLKLKTYFAKRGASGFRNRAKFTNFKSKEFILFNIKNIVVEYEAEGDVAEKLNKIWIKKEHSSSILRNQANVEDMLLLQNEPTWNAHFIFDEIPKDGFLYVEWI